MNVLPMGAGHAPFPIVSEHCAEFDASKNELSIETLAARPDTIQGGQCGAPGEA